MKNILLSMSVIFTMAACQNKEVSTEQAQIPVVPVYNNTASADTAKTEEVFYKPEKIKSTSRKQSLAKRRVYVSSVPKEASENVVAAPIETPVVTAPASTDVSNTPASTEIDKSAGTETASTVPVSEKKKGWSKAAKGAVIGAGAGAIGGAIISKKKGLGAVIGGVIGAAGGYVIGKKMDKNDNRFIAN